MDEHQMFHSWKVNWEGQAGDTGVIYWINPSPGSTVITPHFDLHLTPQHVRRLDPTDRRPLLASALEVRQWGTATDTYLREVKSAGDALIVVRRRFWWLPAKVHRAETTYRDRVRAAAHGYQPFYEQLEQRRADSATELREQARRHKEQMEAQARRLLVNEQARRAAEEHTRRLRQEAFTAAAAPPVWGYLVEAARNRVYVYRHDAPPLTPLLEATQQSESPLTAHQLATALDELEAQGVVKVRWDSAARQAVEQIIGTGLFAQWWSQQILEATPHRSRPAHRGTAHHSSHTDHGYDTGGHSGGHGCGHG